jgi:hypothetical protein
MTQQAPGLSIIDTLDDPAVFAPWFQGETNALRPGLASLPGSVLIGISSPYARSGLLYKKYRDHYGKNSPDVLVIKAPTRTLNPTIDQAVIDAAMADDPAQKATATGSAA